MIKKTIKKIHHYKVGFLVLISLLFLAYLGLNPINISKYYGAMFGSAVGMSVSIPENPMNKLAKQLKDKEAELQQREIELNQKIKKIDNNSGQDRILIWLMGGGIMVLAMLILINFYLDHRHRSKNQD